MQCLGQQFQVVAFIGGTSRDLGSPACPVLHIHMEPFAETQTDPWPAPASNPVDPLPAATLSPSGPPQVELQLGAITVACEASPGSPTLAPSGLDVGADASSRKRRRNRANDPELPEDVEQTPTDPDLEAQAESFLKNVHTLTFEDKCLALASLSRTVPKKYWDKDEGDNSLKMLGQTTRLTNRLTRLTEAQPGFCQAVTSFVRMTSPEPAPFTCASIRVGLVSPVIRIIGTPLYPL